MTAGLRRAVFVVSKHPYGEVQDGDTRVSRLLLEAARESFEVAAIALSERPAPAHGVELIEVRKPPVRMGRIALAGALRRRSLLHTRFAPRELRDAVAAVDADVLVARRAYMAQAMLDSGRTPPEQPLVVLVDVLESTVMRLRRSRLKALLALESRRTRRDEIRCARAASRVGYFSDTERDALASEAGDGPRLDLVLPAQERPAALEEPTALFVGDRRWPPNAEALGKLVELWPRIAAAAPGSRLLVVGQAGPGERQAAAPGIEYLGFVPDLDEMWRAAAVLLAPITIGGGVRVKVLDAASHGVPVVGTPAAIGSVDSYLPVSACPDDDAFVAEAARLLGDAAARRQRGGELYEANRSLAGGGFVERQLEQLLRAC